MSISGRSTTAVLISILALALIVAAPAPGASPASGLAVAEAAKKKKCKKGKVRKKGKCVKKKRASGPTIPGGQYVCNAYVGSQFYGYGTINIHGNTYDSGGSANHPYKYNPASLTITFPSGPYKDYYGIKDQAAKKFQVYAAYSSASVTYGDYLFTCYG